MFLRREWDVQCQEGYCSCTFLPSFVAAPLSRQQHVHCSKHHQCCKARTRGCCNAPCLLPALDIKSKGDTEVSSKDNLSNLKLYQMVCCVRMATSCKTFWSKRVLQRWMHSLVLPCLSCKCWTKKKTAMARSISVSHSFGIKVLQALRALNPLGPLAVPVAAPLCLAQETSRQRYGAWHLGSDSWLRSNYFPEPNLYRRLLLGHRLEERLLNREASFCPLNAPPTQQSRLMLNQMWIRISRLSWWSARSCKLSRQRKKPCKEVK